MSGDSSDRCPVCRAALFAEGAAFGHQNCPRCGAELWFLLFSSGPVFFVRRPRESFSGFVSALLGDDLPLSAADFDLLLATADPLDILEFILQLEIALKRRRS